MCAARGGWWTGPHEAVAAEAPLHHARLGHRRERARGRGRVVLPRLPPCPRIPGRPPPPAPAPPAPGRAARRRAHRQAAARPGKLPDDEVPEGIMAFGHAINGLPARVNGLVESQRRFVADAAHELRTPLAALSLQAQNVDGAESLEAA